MRLFTALEFPPDVHDEIKRVQGELKRLIRSRRWQSMRQAHLTVDFLGETPEPMLEPLQAMLAETCAQASPFELALGAFGGFPNLARARVLWLGVEGERDRLVELEGHTREGLASIGLAVEERPYAPHITLAREPERSPMLTELPERLGVAPLRWRANEVVLFQSELRPEGAVHTVLGRYPLGG